PADHRIRACLPGAGPEAQHRHLWRDLLHADRLPRPARDRGCDHAVRDLGPDDARALHARAPLRLRGGGLVLAFRRRGVADPVRVRLLDLTAGVAPAYGPACGRIRPSFHSSSSTRNRPTDNPTRQVSARSIFCESPWRRDSWNSAEPRNATMVTRTATTMRRPRSMGRL